MAKTDNLKDFLTDVADAIREKSGESGLINPQDFSQKILDIKTGGGGGAVAVSANDVNFRDYDGTILHSYTKDEFLALSAMPELPTREGLICQGWNWDFADAFEYVSVYGVLDVGATYITDDGKTRLYIDIPKTQFEINLYLTKVETGSIVIDWGDGETSDFSLSDTIKLTHTYAKRGIYCITMEVAQGSSLDLGQQSNSLFGSNNNSDTYKTGVLKKIEIGQGVRKILDDTFRHYISLETITIPNNVTSLGEYCFANCPRLKFVNICKTITSINRNLFSYTNLGGITLPNSIASLSFNAFSQNKSISRINCPNVAHLQTSFCDGCSALIRIVIPNGVSILGNYSFRSCEALREVKFPTSVKSIYNGVFANDYALSVLDFSQHEQVPTLADTTSFNSLSSLCRIIVPDALYDEWIAATNWSAKASNIIKKTDWDASQE